MIRAGSARKGRQMAYAFDTLGCAKRLRDAGVRPEEAEAHAKAARDFIMAELVTRQDLEVTRRLLESRIDTLELRLMVRMGGMLAIAVAILAAIMKI
jgi:hypothetical protein